MPVRDGTVPRTPQLDDLAVSARQDSQWVTVQQGEWAAGV